MTKRWLILACLFSIPLCAKPLTMTLTMGDALFKERGNEKKARAALEVYRGYQKSRPKDPEVLWRVAMACQFIGMRYAKDEEKKALFEEGRDAGEASIEAEDKCAPCHFWTAVNSALYGEQVGVFKMLFSVKSILTHLRVTTEIDPTYAYGGAYRIQAIIYQKLPGIFGGDNDKALELYEQALKVSPTELNALFLAKFLKEEKNDELGAAKIAQEALARAPTKDIFELQEAREELKAFIRPLPPHLLSSAKNHSLQ